jgi:hypothetical protein
MLLTGSGDELCELIAALSPIAAYHLPTVALVPFLPLFTESLSGDQLLASPPISSALTVPCPSAACSLFVTQFYFFCGAGSQSVQEAILVVS